MFRRMLLLGVWMRAMIYTNVKIRNVDIRTGHIPEG